MIICMILFSKNPHFLIFFDISLNFQFGGNPVSCAIALKVLDVIEKENLMDNASKVGGYLLKELTALMDKFPVIGDVR